MVCINTFLGATPQVTFEFGRLSSTQTLGNVLLPSTLVTVISTWLAFAVGLSFWPSLAFLTVQQCLAKCDFEKKWHKWIGHVLWSGSGVAVHHLVESIALNWEDDKFVSVKLSFRSVQVDLMSVRSPTNSLRGSGGAFAWKGAFERGVDPLICRFPCFAACVAQW